MDIRVRLLLAFTPLIAVLVFLAVVLPLAAGQSAEVIAQQEAATEDLLRTQELVLAIFFEHDAVGHIAEGEVAPESARYRDARAGAEAIVAAEAENEDPSQQIERQIEVAYRELARLHDEVVAAAAAGDLSQAAALYERPEVDQNLDTIISLSQDARDESRQASTRINTAARVNNQRTITLIGAAFAVGIGLALVLTWLLVRQITHPLSQLTVDAERYAAGEASGQLSQVGNISQIRRLRNSFQALIEANTTRQQRIQSVVDELKERVAHEGRLRKTLQSLSLPVVPLEEDMLLLPLVGYLDEQRARELTSGLLNAIQERHARAVVLDITGLADLDATSAEALRRTVEAARLLGCRIILVGVRSDQAMPLIHANLAASGIEIARDIPAALRSTHGTGNGAR